MYNSEKVSKLVAYFDTTLDLMQNEYISYEQGHKIIESLEPEIINKKDVYSYVQYYNTHKFDYWYNFLFSKDEEALDYLKEMTKHRYASQEALEKIIERFLKMPKKVRKDFYQTNFVEINYGEKSHTEYVSMCEQPFVLAEPSKTFHNLISLYLLSSKSNTKVSIIEDIMYDMKYVLNLNDSKFLDIYGNTLIHTLEKDYIYKNWKYLEMNERKDFQEAFTTRLIYRGVLKFDAIEDLIEKKYLPYDVKHPRGNKYLMSAIINHKLNYVTDYLRVHGFSIDEFKERMEQTKKYMREINEKYDLYFFNHSILTENSKLMTSNFSSCFRNKFQDKSSYAEMESEILKYQLEIDDIFKKRELKQTKKMKL